MSEAQRSVRVPGQLVLTRGHLYALASMSLTMAALAFFVGLQAGRGGESEPTAPVVTALLDQEARTGELEALLMRVEAAHPPERFVFPEELPRSAPPLAPALEGAEVVPLVVDAVVRPAEPHLGGASVPGEEAAPQASDLVPERGWAVQVGVRDSVAEADTLVSTLREAGLASYQVQALVDGRPEFRVRVGGFASEAAAAAALPEIRGRSGATTASVTPAP